ncbi:MAG: hypothetical protein ACFE8P_13050 [Promethearchaeota archaeon]
MSKITIDFCAIDYRAKRALIWLKIRGESKLHGNVINSHETYLLYITIISSTDDVNLYYKYLDIIKGLGKMYDLTPREVELALWKYDKTKDEAYF